MQIMDYCWNKLFTKNVIIIFHRSDCARPPELSRLKCVGYHPKDNTGSNALQTEQFLVCRVTSRYNHRSYKLSNYSNSGLVFST